MVKVSTELAGGICIITLIINRFYEATITDILWVTATVLYCGVILRAVNKGKK